MRLKVEFSSLPVEFPLSCQVYKWLLSHAVATLTSLQFPLKIDESNLISLFVRSLCGRKKNTAPPTFKKTSTVGWLLYELGKTTS